MIYLFGCFIPFCSFNLLYYSLLFSLLNFYILKFTQFHWDYSFYIFIFYTVSLLFNFVHILVVFGSWLSGVDWLYRKLLVDHFCLFPFSFFSYFMPFSSINCYFVPFLFIYLCLWHGFIIVHFCSYPVCIWELTDCTESCL